MPRLFVYSRKGRFSQISFKGKKITLGRSPENDVVVKDPYSSNLHAYIYPSDGGYALRDNNSKNGTFLNSKRVLEEVELKKGDEILIGSTRILFNKQLSTHVEVIGEDTAITNVRTVLPLKEVLKKPDISTTIRVRVKEPDLEALSRENRFLAAINAVAQELLLSRPEPELIDKIMEIINGILPMDRGTLLLMEGNPLHLQPKSTCINNRLLTGKSFTVSQNILNMVVDKRSSLLVSDVKADSRLGSRDSVIISKIHSALCVPLCFEEEILGVIYSDRIYILEPFSDEDLHLLTLVANLAAAKIDDSRKRKKQDELERIKKQLELAAQIQRTFLPKESPEFEGYDIAGQNVPTYQLGGDYYDYLPVGSNRLGIAIADVSGKGAAAAFYMVSFRTQLKAVAVDDYDIQEMASRLNDFVHRETDLTQFVTFFYCELDNSTGMLKYVNAGHSLPIVLRKKGKIERLKSCGMCLGMFPSEKYDAYSVALEKGDIAVLYTDGITECRNEDCNEFGENRFMNLIKKNSMCSAEELLGKVYGELDLFSKGTDQMDDMTLVVIKKVA